jgi:hypothetical protein
LVTKAGHDAGQSTRFCYSWQLNCFITA